MRWSFDDLFSARVSPKCYMRSKLNLWAHVALGEGPGNSQVLHAHPKPTKYVPFWAKCDALDVNDCRVPQLRNAPSLGFHNWVGAVEGNLRKQNYQIQKLEFELAQAKYKTGKIEEDKFREGRNQI